MKDVIHPKRQTLDERLLQGFKTISKPQIHLLMLILIVPPKNLIFNKESYKCFKSSSKPTKESIKTEPLKTVKVMTEIKEDAKDLLRVDDLYYKPITFIDDEN